MGVPVYLDGNVIDLGVYKLMVAEACSGLRYLFPIMSFSYVFAVLYRGPLWHKLTLLLFAVPVAVLMNSVRIGIIGILVDRYGIAQAEGFLHVFEGWVVFLSCIAILFRPRQGDAVGHRRPPAARRGARPRLLRPRRPARAGRDDRAVAGADRRRADDGGALRRLGARAAARPRAGGARALQRLPARARRLVGDAPRRSTPNVAETLGADDYLSAFYRAPGEAEGVDLFLSFYRSQTDGNAIHSPEVCLPAAGWEVAAIRPIAVALPGTRTGAITLNRAVIQKGLEKQLVYYWFEGRGRHMTNDFAAKFYALSDSLTRGRTDGGLVRLITPDRRRTARRRPTRGCSASSPPASTGWTASCRD